MFATAEETQRHAFSVLDSFSVIYGDLVICFFARDQRYSEREGLGAQADLRHS
jgi:hypothetical protein